MAKYTFYKYSKMIFMSRIEGGKNIFTTFKFVFYLPHLLCSTYHILTMVFLGCCMQTLPPTCASYPMKMLYMFYRNVIMFIIRSTLFFCLR